MWGENSPIQKVSKLQKTAARGDITGIREAELSSVSSGGEKKKNQQSESFLVQLIFGFI